MKNRRISVNIRKMLDIMHEVDSQDLEAVVLSLDFVKCFDKCSFSILFGSLSFFGFGEVVKKWTDILYRDFSVKIQNNGCFSEEIEIKKGVHQGGCCSSLYFLIIAEILALSLRDNKEIDGLTLAQIRQLLNQFADDMDIFSLCNEKSIKAIFRELSDFKQHSGFTVSYEKTTLYRIGSLKHSDATLYNLSEYAWSNKDINVLGVTIAHEDIVNKNYSVIVQNVRNTLGKWYHRDLTLMGKVQVVNTLCASLFVYKMMVLPEIPNKVVKNVENVVRDFLWNGKKSKISFAILQNPKSQGGLGLFNLRIKDSALKATWPKILHDEQDYATLVYKIMRVSELREDIWRCSISPQDVESLSLKNNFWKDVLQAWSKYNYFKNNREEVQLIWYNSKIKIKGKIFFWKDAYSKGLRYIHQLFENKEFKSHELIHQQYGLTCMRYNSLKEAIPKEWKLFFRDNHLLRFSPQMPSLYDNMLLCTNFSKNYYKYMEEDVMLLHNKYLGWRKEVSDFTESLIDFGKEFNKIYKTTNITKYRDFQYRLLQRGLITNIHLFKWKIRESDLCTFCQYDRESVTHLMFYCPQVNVLWKQVFKMMGAMTPSIY